MRLNRKFEEEILEHRKDSIPEYKMKNINKAPKVNGIRSDTFKVWYMNEYGHAIPDYCYWDGIEKEWRKESNGKIIGKEILAMEGV